MKIKNLSKTPLSEIVQCFSESFVDYFVKMPGEVAFWEKRWKGARVDYRYSYGMFENGKLVAFMIHGIDDSQGLKTAFNTGTGVIPEYRGQRIVKQMYDFAIPELKNAGIQKCSLEVICENDKAIKAYQSVGFEITKTLKCYNGELKVPEISGFRVVQKSLDKINWEEYPAQNRFSWDYHKNGLLLFKELWQCFDVFDGHEKIAYFIIYPKNGTLAQFDVFEDTDQNWTKLFNAISQISKNLKINNIDDRQKSKIQTMERFGINNFLDQFEMEVLL